LSGTGFGKALVDIGNDGKVEFQANAGKEIQKDFQAVAGPKGMTIKISSDSGASLQGKGTSSYENGLVVMWIPEPSCTYTSYGQGCGPILTGSAKATPGGAIIFLKLTKAPKASPLGLFLGDRAISRKIPGTSCTFLVNPVVFLPYFTNSLGEATMVPGATPFTPISFYAQAIILERTTFKVFLPRVEGTNEISEESRSPSRSLAGWASGFGAHAMGYAPYFLLTFFLAFPAYLLLPWVSKMLNYADNQEVTTNPKP